MFHHSVHHILLLLPHPSPGLVHQEVHPQDSPKNSKIQLSEHVKDSSWLLVGRTMKRSNHNEWTHIISNKNKGLVAANVKLKTKPIHTKTHMCSVCCNSTWCSLNCRSNEIWTKQLPPSTPPHQKKQDFWPRQRRKLFLDLAIMF